MPTRPTDDRLLITDHPSPLTSHDLILGIDGGGTRTVALLAAARDAGGDVAAQILGRGVGRPSNYQSVGRTAAVASLQDAVGQAFAEAGIGRGSVAAACLGLAGADRVGDRAMLTDWAASIELATRVRIENDGMIVLAAGTPAGWGIAVIAGTGSLALARTPEGRTARAGGWGYLFGDEGSAYDVAIAGLRATARAADGRGPATSLGERFCGRLNIDRAEALVPAIYGNGLDRAGIAALVDVLTGAACDGDDVAISILESAAGELAEMASAAARIIPIDSRATVPVALAGGMLLGYEPLRVGVVAGLRRRGLKPDPVRPVTEPALGAIRLAREFLE